MVVQRKWMYLESIFIGGDIRAQLPEEAKKFDDIDKTFKKVCNFWYSNKTWKKCSCEIMAKEEQFFRLVVSFPSQGFHWSGNGKGKWKFLRARKSQGILFWVRKTWYFEETSGWFGTIEGWKKHSGSLWSQRSQWSYWRRKILLNNYPS